MAILNYFLWCANQICFQQVFLTAQGRNWAKRLYIGASPKTHTTELNWRQTQPAFQIHEQGTAALPGRLLWSSQPLPQLPPAVQRHQSNTSHQGGIREKSHHTEVNAAMWWWTNISISARSTSLSFHWPQWSWSNLILSLDSFHSSSPWPYLSAGESLCWRKKGAKAGLLECTSTWAITPH